MARKDTPWLSGAGNTRGFPSLLTAEGSRSRNPAPSPPAADPEQIGDAADFPDAAPFATKRCTEPPGVPSYEFVTVYKAALQQAGCAAPRGAVAGNAEVLAHCAKDARGLWLHARGDGNRQHVTGSDLDANAKSGAPNKDFEALGHVALSGIYSDIDIIPLGPESEMLPRRIPRLLSESPAPRLEVQGHTDNTGSAGQ